MRNNRLFVDVTAMVSGMKVTIFVDVDQTISTGHVAGSLAESVSYYRDLGVEIPDTIESWPALFQLPDVARQHEVLPDALIGVWQLDGVGEVFYATARKPDVEQITRDWLSREGFPKPEHVIFCQGVSEKLLAIAEHPGPLILVDDRWRQLLSILEEYGEHRVLRGLHDRLTLVAFGSSQADMPASSVVPVVPIPEWSSITELLTRFTSVVVPSRKDVL